MSRDASTLDSYSSSRVVYVDTARRGKPHVAFDGEKVFTVGSLTEIHAEELYIDVLHQEIYREVSEVLKRGVRVYLLRDASLIKKVRDEKKMEKSDENDVIVLSQIPSEYFRPLTVGEIEKKVRINSLVNYYTNIVKLKKTLSQWVASSRVWTVNLEEAAGHIPWIGVLERFNPLRESLSNSIKILEDYIKELSKIVLEEAEKIPVYREVLRKIGLSYNISLALQILRIQAVKDPRKVSVASLTGLYGYRPAKNGGKYDHRLRELSDNLALQLYCLARNRSLKETPSNKKIIEIASGMDKYRAVYRIGLELVKTIGETYLEVYGRGVDRDEYSEELIRIPYCILCGGIGVDLGKVGERDVAMCPDCAREFLHPLRELVKAAERLRESDK